MFRKFPFMFQLINHNQLQPQQLNQTVIQLSYLTQSTEYLKLADNLTILPKYMFLFLLCAKGVGWDFIFSWGCRDRKRLKTTVLVAFSSSVCSVIVPCSRWSWLVNAVACSSRSRIVWSWWISLASPRLMAVKVKDSWWLVRDLCGCSARGYTGYWCLTSLNIAEMISDNQRKLY